MATLKGFTPIFLRLSKTSSKNSRRFSRSLTKTMVRLEITKSQRTLLKVHLDQLLLETITPIKEVNF